MERLTEETVGCFKYRLKDHKAEAGEFGTYDAFFDYATAVKRLGEYEDTGLTPEALKDMVENAETMLLTWFESRYGFPVGELMALCEAKQEGLLVKLPCKVGTKVWLLFDGATHEIRVQGISVSYSGAPILHFGGYPAKYAFGSEIGSTIFLTYEEAESALREMEGPANGSAQV